MKEQRCKLSSNTKPVHHYQVPDSVEECLSGDMDACKDAIDAVEAALGIEVFIKIEGA